MAALTSLAVLDLPTALTLLSWARCMGCKRLHMMILSGSGKMSDLGPLASLQGYLSHLPGTLHGMHAAHACAPQLLSGSGELPPIWHGMQRWSRHGCTFALQ